MIKPLLVTIPDAARILGISRATLYRLVLNGGLPSVRIGRCRRIKASDLEAFMNNLPAYAVGTVQVGKLKAVK